MAALLRHDREVERAMTTQTNVPEKTREANAVMYDHHTPEVITVWEYGWEWVLDLTHPKNQEMGLYTAMGRDDGYGWFTKEGHPRKSRVEGDSRPRWQAAKTVLEVWM